MRQDAREASGAVVIAVLVVVAFLGLSAYGLYSMGDRPIHEPPPPTWPPDRYAEAPKCASIAAKIPGLPPLITRAEAVAQAPDPASTRVVTSCSWYEYGKPANTAYLYLSNSLVPGSGEGESRAKTNFATAPGENVEPIPGLATAAAFYDEQGHPEQCWLKLYQANVYAQLYVNGDPDKATCRAAVKKLAVAVTEALN
ncbi:hypothetical protein AB5J62_35640 [Amycolatopsis sp. cg5]|uniref:hypothetical protein n=1 Tax=Amycolatopsis sp. cg5 TaxID=3238802 RepID=UPI0035247588